MRSANSAASFARCARPVRACACWQNSCQQCVRSWQISHSHHSGLPVLEHGAEPHTPLFYNGGQVRKEGLHGKHIMCEHALNGKTIASGACGNNRFHCPVIRVCPPQERVRQWQVPHPHHSGVVRLIPPKANLRSLPASQAANAGRRAGLSFVFCSAGRRSAHSSARRISPMAAGYSAGGNVRSCRKHVLPSIRPPFENCGTSCR